VKKLRSRAAVVTTAALIVLAACSGESADDAAGTPQPSESPHPSTSPAPSPLDSPSPSTEASTAVKPPSGQEQADLDRRLIAAAWDNDLVRARRLIEHGADVNAKDDSEQSAYLIATSEGYLRLLELTLRHGADVGSLDSFNGTGLIRAADRGHHDIVGRLVQARIDLDHLNNLGWTALHEAIILGDGSRRYVDTVRVLVAAGADVAIPSREDGVLPLRHAESKGFDEIAEGLRRALASDRRGEVAPDVADGRLLRAAASGNADAAAIALRQGADIEARDGHRRTPLLLAVTEDRLAVARLLVALGASPDALDDRHDTPWLVTGVTGSVPMLEVLLPADPDLTIRNRFGGLSVIPASERGHVDYVRRVVQTAIEVNHVNDLGWTALLEAVILGDGSGPYQQIVRILLGAGADPAITDNEGRTALQHAEASGQDEVARILRRAG
jgi:ankyrin repeat protein